MKRCTGRELSQTQDRQTNRCTVHCIMKLPQEGSTITTKRTNNKIAFPWKADQ